MGNLRIYSRGGSGWQEAAPVAKELLAHVAKNVEPHSAEAVT